LILTLHPLCLSFSLYGIHEYVEIDSLLSVTKTSAFFVSDWCGLAEETGKRKQKFSQKMGFTFRYNKHPELSCQGFTGAILECQEKNVHHECTTKNMQCQ